jgi:hypothetical protein
MDSDKKWTMFSRGTPKDYWSFGEIRSDFDHEPLPVIRQLRAPLLVIFGGRDDLGPALQDSLGELIAAMRVGGTGSLTS